MLWVLSKRVVLYSPRLRKPQECSHWKKVVVPRQSMSLKDILRRFVKRESLPLVKEGTYEDRYDYDLEKLAKEDRVVQDEVISDLKARTKELDAKIAKHRKDELDKAAVVEKAEVDKRIADAVASASGGIKS